MSASGAATARAPANIAFIKYWGDRDPALRLPLNGSLSMNLSAANTTTTVRLDPNLDADVVCIDGVVRHGSIHDRVVKQLDLIRRMAGLGTFASVESANNFPMGTGIASSASGFAALTVAAATAMGLDLDGDTLSRLARRASGSASRSVPTGFVEWRVGLDDASSFASSIAPPEHWDLCDMVAVVDRSPKAYPSSAGHTAGKASPLLSCRLADVAITLPAVRSALLARDLLQMGPLVEAEALSLHAVAMTGLPSILYFGAGTLVVLHAVRKWRDAGLPCYFTLDAGPNVHVLCEAQDASAVLERLNTLDVVEDVLENRAGRGAELLES